MGEGRVGFQAGDTNLYRYVGNDSTNAVDLTGEERVPLFQGGSPDPFSVKQGSSNGDCWLIAAIVGLAYQRPNDIPKMFSSIKGKKDQIRIRLPGEFILDENVGVKDWASGEYNGSRG